MRRTIIALLAAIALVAVLLPAGAGAVSAADGVHGRRTTLPPKKVWLAKVRKKLAGANAYLDQQAAGAADPARLAIVLDIDNTSLQSHYAWPKPVKPTRKVARHAVALGMKVFFVTGRKQRALGQVTPQLAAAGYRYAGICGLNAGEGLTAGKQRCRAAIAASGYTVVLDIGNRATDLVGANVGRGIKLPSYDGLLS